MKRNTLNIKSTLLIGSLISGGAVFGMDIDPRFYLGFEGQADRSRIAKQLVEEKNDYEIKIRGNKPLFKKDGAGIGAFVGLNLSEYFGIEGGYLWLGNKKDKAANRMVAVNHEGDIGILNDVSNLTLKQHNIYGDILGYIPVSNEAKLIGSLGVGLLSSKYHDKNHISFLGENVTIDFKKTYKKAGMRFGLGAQFVISENIRTRLMARYQKGNKVVKNMTSLALGLFYQF